MPDDNPDVETAIIHAAYADKVKDAFMVFAENLAGGQAEKLCKDRFLRALLLVKKARDLALETMSGMNVVEPQAPSAQSARESGERATEQLSAEHQALIDAAVGGTTGVAKPVLLR